MKRFLLWFLLALSCVFSAFSLDWPVKTIALTATFGESRNDHFHNGIDLGGGEQPVYPVQEGEIIFYQEEGEFEDDLPAGLGSFVLLESKGGILSSYGHLKKGSIEKSKTLLTSKDVIGIIGDTGYSFGKHLHLTLYDRELGQTVNPLLALPSLEDKRKPIIRNVFLSKGDETISLENFMSVKPGQYELVTESYDLSEFVSYFCPMAPYGMLVLAQGEEVMSLIFDALAMESTNLVLLNKGKPLAFEDLYGEIWKTKSAPIVLSPGKLGLEVVVSDFAGNQSIRQYVILVAE